MSLVKVSALFAVSIVIQQVAYLGTSVTNASFLVNTATVMTPLAAWLLIGERATAVIWLAAGATLVGVLLLSGGLSASFSRGDLATHRNVVMVDRIQPVPAQVDFRTCNLK